MCKFVVFQTLWLELHSLAVILMGDLLFCRVRLYDEAFGIVGEVRQEAMEAMKKFTPRTAEKGK